MIRLVCPILVLALGLPRAAAACSFAFPGYLEADDSLPDTGPPVLDGDSIEAHVQTRGVGPDCDGTGGCSSTSCDDLGQILVRFDPATDPDGTSVDEAHVQLGVGYRLRVLDGDGPIDLALGDDPRLAGINQESGQASLMILWADGAEDEQEAFGFTLGITPVDPAGNEGEEQGVWIEDPGREAPTGCSALGAAGLGWGWLLGAGLALGRRRAQA